LELCDTCQDDSYEPSKGDPIVTCGVVQY
jgi:hypothetical protein